MQARRVPSGGFAKDSLDIEGYVRAFARRRPDVDVAVLRFTNFIGPRIDSLLTGFFRMPVVPTALGYDARVQLLHEDDALAVLDPRHDRRLRRHGQRRRRGHAAAVPGDPPARPVRGAAAHARAGLGRPAVPPLRLRGLLAGADALPQLRPRRRHHGAARASSATPRVTRPRPRWTTTPVPSRPCSRQRLVQSATSRVRSVLARAGDAASAVGERLRPAPPAPGLRAVRDA